MRANAALLSGVPVLVYEFCREVEWFWGLDTCVDDEVIKTSFSGCLKTL